MSTYRETSLNVRQEGYPWAVDDSMVRQATSLYNTEEISCERKYMAFRRISK